MTASIPANWRDHVSSTNESPSRRHNISAEQELTEMQSVANFIQELARKLGQPLLCINTAIMYTQRFYLYHSLATFEKYCVGAAAVFLAGKVEDHARKVEYVHQVAKNLGRVPKDTKESDYIDDVLVNESIMLQTLGFEIYIEHPHSHVLRLCEKFKMSKQFSQTAYILATYCLQLTRMCLYHKPAVVACLCIRMACRMLKETPPITETKVWFQDGEPSLTETVLEGLCDEFQAILNTCPQQWKSKTLVNNHQNLANKIAMTPAGLRIFGEPFKSDPNTRQTEMKRSNSLERISRRTADNWGKTPQTQHRFSEVPAKSTAESTAVRSIFDPIDNGQVSKKPPTEAPPKSHQLLLQAFRKENPQNTAKVQASQPSSSENKPHSRSLLLPQVKQKQDAWNPKPTLPEKKKDHSESKPSSSEKKQHPQDHSQARPSTSEKKKHHHELPDHRPNFSDKKKYHQDSSAYKSSSWEKKKHTTSSFESNSDRAHYSSHLSKPKSELKKSSSEHKKQDHGHGERKHSGCHKAKHKSEWGEKKSDQFLKPEPSQKLAKSSLQDVYRSSSSENVPKIQHRHAAVTDSSARSASKTEESLSNSDGLNQRKASHSANQFWPGSTVDFSFLSDPNPDFNALLAADMDPPFQAIPRDLSVSSTAGGMDMLQISTTDKNRFNRSSAEHFPKRFKPNTTH